MRRAGLAALLATLVLAGCGGGNALRQASRASPLERDWLGNWHTNVASAPVAHDASASLLRRQIADRALQLHLRVLRLRIYRFDHDVPSVTVEASRPVPFLRDGLLPLLGALGNGPKHLLAVNAHGRLVFELWSNGTGGGSRSEPGVSGCNVLLEPSLGLPPPCPPEGILGFEFG